MWSPRTIATALLLSGASAAMGQYVYDYPGTAWSWATNGSVSTSGPTGFPGTGGSYLSTTAIPGAVPNDYEINTSFALKSGGGTYIQFLRTSGSTVQAGTGSYVSVELVVAAGYTSPGVVQLNVNQCINGTITQLGATVVPFPDGSTLRSVMMGNTLEIFVNNWPMYAGYVNLLTGNPGIGGYGIPAGSGFNLNLLKLGHRETVAPTAVDSRQVASSVLPNSVSLKWRAVQDDPNGTGLAFYVVYRNGVAIGDAPWAEFTDAALYPATNYSYFICGWDFHQNSSCSASVAVTTPPAQAVDPRRIGIRPTGAYWGGGGEQIDMDGGNLNFSLPLLNAQGRTGWTVPVSLTYNSQSWRQDNGVNWQLGTDLGYGFGWKILVGSITPYYTSWSYGVDHYGFTDATGAEYRLDVNNGGVWSSTQGIYVWYDANANVLHFNNGMFWAMGCTSGGVEADAGTLYPTVIEDVNGNQVIVSYLAGGGLAAGATNTSSRISTIEDVRGKGLASYTLSWVGQTITVANSIGTPETWTLNTSNSQTKHPPFGADGINWGNLVTVSSLVGGTGTWAFTYDPSGSDELTRVDFPDGGHVRWTYATATYSGSRLLREVATRYVANTASAAEWAAYTFSHDDSSNPNPTVHANTTLVDASGVGAKTWKFTLPDGNAADAWKVGLTSDFLQKASAAGAVLTHDSYVWNTNSNAVPYIASKTTVLDEGTANQRSMSTAQQADGYGNATQSSLNDYSGLTVRTYTTSWLQAANASYANAYVRNKPLVSGVADNLGHSVTLASNTYDQGTLSAVSSPTEFDAVQGAATNHIRGNLTQRAAMGSTANITYDVTGNALTGMDAAGSGGSASYSFTTNFAAPGAGLPMAGTPDAQNGHSPTQAAGSQLSSSYGYNNALSLVQSTMPNSASTTQTFSPTTGLLTSSVSVHGATTNYVYTFNPPTVTATTNGHWSKAYKDGFGRDLAVESGFGTTVVSHVDNQYGPCACSPLGKLVATSQPYGIGAGGAVVASDGTANIAWTTYVYDGLGRTVTMTAPDGSATHYAYAGNATKVTDPAGNWKRSTNDALGNLTMVEEPNPQYGQADSSGTNFVTNYTYDLMGHMTLVQMPRPNGGGTYTQTRTFNYDLPTGHLLSTMNPENGTTAYGYYGSGRLKSKTDAKGQKVLYSYDGYGRLAYTDRFPDGVTWDPCQSVAFNYDSSLSGTNGLGRVSQAVTGQQCSSANTLNENWWYTPGGLVTQKSYNNSVPDLVGYDGTEYGPYSYGPVATFSYDTEGHMTGYGPFLYTLDAMGRPTGLTETAPGTVWVQNAAYGPGGEMKTMQYRTSGGGYYTENHTFNNRAQMIQQQTSGTGLTGMNLQYVYAAGVNNGQITQMNDLLTGEQMSYTYDSLKRLAKAETTQAGGTQWGQSFGYDGFGNLTTKNPTAGHTGTAMALSVDPATNWVTTAGFAYDANGNATSIAAAPQNIALTYDVENRTGGSRYDQQNQPLDRAGTGNLNGPWNLYGLRGERLGTYSYAVTSQVYNMGNHLFVWRYTTETQLSRNIYFGGRLIVSNGKAAVTDRLGSVRANEAGETFKYYSYGEETTLANPQDREKFGTYTRESATGLDYADQRYYASIYGRFNRPDPFGGSARAGNPGSWNRYGYTLGDPVNSSDPSGLYGGDGCSEGFIATDQGVCQIDYFGYDPDPADNFANNPAGYWLEPVGVGAGDGGESSHPAAAHCDISVAGSGVPRGQNLIGSGVHAPTTNTLGQYATPDGWNFAVQIQGNLFEDMNGADWLGQQTASSSGTFRPSRGSPAQSLYTATQKDDPDPFAISDTFFGRYDWIDYPGVNHVYSALGTYNFNSSLTNRITGAKCSVDWALNIRVINGGQKWSIALK